MTDLVLGTIEAECPMIRWFRKDDLLKRTIATTEYANVASQTVMLRLGITVEHNPPPVPVWFQVVGILENAGKNES